MTGKRVRVFVSSPGDVDDERRQCGEVIQELNATMHALIPERDVELDLVRWETHTFPDLADNAQSVVDDQINPVDCDIFIGIMWSRFGTPTLTAGSGTEHEFRAAQHGWKAVGRPAHILFYFCNAAIPPQMSVDVADQLKAVNAFRNELMQQGLVGSYEDRSRFADQVRRDLVRVVSRLLYAGVSAARIAHEAAQRVTNADLAVVREQVNKESDEYELLRSTMPPGDLRTRRMEVVASRLRALAQSLYPLLSELKASDHVGHRLAALCVLQVIPAPDSLDWLSERICAEKQPFVVYHAAVALLSAARNLTRDHLVRVQATLDRAQQCQGHLRPDTDRAITLDYVRREIAQRLSGGDAKSGARPASFA